MTGYLGVQFEAADGTHYGWIRIRGNSFISGGVFLDFAYETEPDTPILAGATPEPSVLFLLGLGGMAIWRRRRG